MATLDANGNELDALQSAEALGGSLDTLRSRTGSLTVSVNGFSYAMARAFTQATAGGKQFDDVLKSLALRISSLALSSAFKPLTHGIAGSLNNLLSGLFGGSGGARDANGNIVAALGAIKPFASGGVIGAPTYFPLSSGGLGLAGEAGPEAIMPLTRDANGRLGVAMSGGAPAAITVNISTPDLDSVRRSQAYLTGQIARAVARGQRTM
jgi:phage-related minor tail protein